MSASIYLDNNATTHIDPIVAERMHELNLAAICNPASQHQPGRHALHLLEEAKSEILRSVGATADGMEADRVILTSGGTEANNLFVRGMQTIRPGVTIVGGTDHPSVIEAARLAGPDNCRILPVDHLGACDLNVLEEWLQEVHHLPQRRVSCVSVMLGNNESGVIQDLYAITSICRKFDVPVHSDIVQAVGKIPVDFRALGLAAATVTGHKIHGPVGVGALIINPSLQLDPLIVGGSQQLGLRAGTEPVVPAVGFALSLKLIVDALAGGEFDDVRLLRDRFEDQLSSQLDVSVLASEAARLPHTSNIAFPGVDRQALHMALDLNRLACSTGSACASGSSRPSGVLVAMGLPDELIQSSLRFSFSRFSTETETDQAVKIIVQAATKCTVNS